MWNYLYEYLLQREKQASFTENIQAEHDYLAELRKLNNDPELKDKAMIAWDEFEDSFFLFWHCGKLILFK